MTPTAGGGRCRCRILVAKLWLDKRNPWFETELLPILRTDIAACGVMGGPIPDASEPKAHRETPPPRLR